MEKLVDLNAYFARIGYDGTRSASIETLRALHALHPAAIPFEAIDVLLGRGIDIRAAAVDAKLIHARRGGYCFEQNGLFRRVLLQLGFEVEFLAARVRCMSAPQAPPAALSHMALSVFVDDSAWLVDVGFGGCVLTAPLRFDTREAQQTGHESFRLINRDGHIQLQALLDDGWQPVYDLSQERQYEIDYQQRNWFTATHPESPFRQKLMVARSTPQARYSLLDNRLTMRRTDGQAKRSHLNAAEIEQALADIFSLPVEPAWRPIIEEAALQHAA